ncbi:UNVERIFIED_CONTAM: hypothetical protein Q9R71_02040 [Actinomycetes bacterium ARC8]|nr:hypothetical protein [Actinomycetes bacterium ARC8]
MSVLRRRLPVLAGAAALLAGTLAGCAVQVPDEVNAQWALIDPSGVNASSTSLELGVMGLACASGKTGDVTAIHVDLADGQIAIGIAVEPLEGEAQDCQGNETVPYTLELGEPVGDRVLIDASCLDRAEQQAPNCSDGGIRWSSPATPS